VIGVRRLIFATCLIVAIFAVIVFFRTLQRSDELGSKPEASFLQALEVEYRNKPLTPELIIRRRDDYCAVGIVAKNRRERVWLLLNAKHPPLVKLSSSAEYHLTPTDINWLKGQCPISDAVYQTLEQHAQ